ncbi:hypothetical protein GH733_018778 [Mirounga leonina]|nr:hypothetical protein GH733_018778 [Mirounga leonina]
MLLVHPSVEPSGALAQSQSPSHVADVVPPALGDPALSPGSWTWDCLQEWGSYIQLAIPSMFMLPLGFGVAASVRVGNALGAGNAEQARYSSITVLLCAVYFSGSKRDIIYLVSQVMPIFAPFHLFDALAGTCGGVLRGTGKQKIGAILNAIGYYVFGFPIGVSLMFAAKLGIIDLPVLEKEVTDGVVLPDIITPESQTLQLMVLEESNQYAVSTIGGVLTTCCLDRGWNCWSQE